jgi:hypothetical protein
MNCRRFIRRLIEAEQRAAKIAVLNARRMQHRADGASKQVHVAMTALGHLSTIGN